MTMESPFQSVGLAPNLMPNPPPSMPETPSISDATATLSPFSEPQNVESIIKQLVLDRPLKLFIPNREKYPEWEFRIINSIPAEIVDANNKGWRQVTDEKLVALFDGLHAGVDKTGKAYRPLLFARSKKIGEHVMRQQRMKLSSIYAGMDPSNKELDGKYTSGVDKKDGTFGNFTGWGFRIRA
jgi:hypothetical protein